MNPIPTMWTETGTADNAVNTQTRSADADTTKAHYITGLSASFSAAVAGALLTLKDGSTVIGNWYVHNQFTVAFQNPIKITPGNDAVAALAASGTGGVLGAVTLIGYTRR